MLKTFVFLPKNGIINYSKCLTPCSNDLNLSFLKRSFLQNLAKVGDLIIDSDQISVISKIENNLIFFTPFIKDKNAGKSEIISSIPFENFFKAGIRFLLTKDEIKTFLKDLTTQKPLSISAVSNKNSNSLKEYLYLNDPLKTGQLLILLNQRQQNGPLSKIDQLIFNQALEHLSQEISVVNQIDIKVAQKQILTSLSKNTQPDNLLTKAN